MSNVTKLHDHTDTPILAPNEPNEELIGALEKMLTDARSGKLRALAYVGSLTSHKIISGWANAADTQDALGSGILTLAYRYGKACDGG